MKEGNRTAVSRPPATVEKTQRAKSLKPWPSFPWQLLMAPALCDLPAKAWTRLDVTRSRLARRWSAFPNGFGRTTKHT